MIYGLLQSCPEYTDSTVADWWAQQNSVTLCWLVQSRIVESRTLTETKWLCRPSWKVCTTLTSGPECWAGRRTTSWSPCWRLLTILLQKRPPQPPFPALPRPTLSLQASHLTRNYSITLSQFLQPPPAVIVVLDILEIHPQLAGSFIARLMGRSALPVKSRIILPRSANQNLKTGNRYRVLLATVLSQGQFCLIARGSTPCKPQPPPPTTT